MGSSLYLQGRALEDGKTGWVCYASGSQPPLRPWSKKYVCRAPVAITPSLAAKNADAVRHAEPGEKFEAVEFPSLDKTTGVRRVRCTTATDGFVGWATLSDADGK